MLDEEVIIKKMGNENFEHTKNYAKQVFNSFRVYSF